MRSAARTRRAAGPALLLALVLAFLSAPPALAAAPAWEVEVTFNGFDLDLNHPAWVENGATLAPVEELCAALGMPEQLVGAGGDLTPIPGGCSYGWAAGGEAFSASWYGGEPVSVVPGEGGARWVDGVLYAPLRPFAEGLGLDVGWDGRAQLSDLDGEQYKTVSTLEELFSAVDHRTTLILDAGEGAVLDLSAVDWSRVDSPYVHREPGVDGRDEADGGHPEAFEVVIQGVHDLCIALNGATLSTPWAYADVLKFRDCHRLTLMRVGAAHDVEPGYCTGDCLSLENCRGVLISRSNLDGSGAYGLSALESADIRLEKCEISHCTYGALSLSGCERVSLWMTSIRDCRTDFSLLSGWDCREVRLWETMIYNNSAAALAGFGGGSHTVVLEGCSFEDNEFGAVNAPMWDAAGGAVLLDCRGEVPTD